MSGSRGRRAAGRPETQPRLPVSEGAPCHNRGVVASRQHRHVGETLERLAHALEDLEFGPRAADLAAERDRLVGTIRSYLVPRSADPTTPLMVVVAGPTGSGKSTLVNSLAGVDASPTGALRPTTRAPVVVAPGDAGGDYESIGGVRCEVVSAGPGARQGVVIVDTPDIDSTSTGHRAMSEILVDNADVVVFVTSARRYADQVPWEVLRRAESRGTPVIHVLNRVESASSGSILDFKSRLAAAGFGKDLITVSEHHLPERAERVPDLAVRSLRRRLDAVMADRDEFAAEAFAGVARATLTGIQALVGSITDIQDEIDSLEAGAALDLLARVPNLDLGHVASGLHPRPPERRNPLARMLWARRARKDRPEVGEMEAAVVDRIVHAVDSDVRRWLVEEGASLRRTGVDAPYVVDGVLASTRSAAEGWIDFVARIAADFDERNRRLGEAVLLEAATVGSHLPAVDRLFGEEGPTLVDRARRELAGRLEVVYEHAGGLVAEGLRRRYGDVDDSELRQLLGAATAVLAPVHA